MNVAAIEYGERPRFFTKARRFAPEGAKIFAEVLEHLTFADDALVVLDWDNTLRRQPEEVARPVLIVQTGKLVEGLEPNNFITVEVRLDVEDLFGKDEITAENMLDVVHEMEQKIIASIEKRRSQV